MITTDKQPSYEMWAQMSRLDKFQHAKPCWKSGRLMSILSSDGRVIINVRKSDGSQPSARIEW